MVHRQTKKKPPLCQRGLFLIQRQLPLLAVVPVVHFFCCLILGVAIPLLQPAFQLILLAVDDVEIVIGELAPLLLNLALDLLPVAFAPSGTLMMRPCLSAGLSIHIPCPERTMAEKDLSELFVDTLKDIYYAEKQIYKSLPKMANAANSDQLRAAFDKHHDETEGQIVGEDLRTARQASPRQEVRRHRRRLSDSASRAH